MYEPINAIGGPLEPCSIDPKTGFYRDGSCNCGPDNPGVHGVCIYATKEFLEYFDGMSIGSNDMTSR